MRRFWILLFAFAVLTLASGCLQGGRCHGAEPLAAPKAATCPNCPAAVSTAYSARTVRQSGAVVSHASSYSYRASFGRQQGPVRRFFQNHPGLRHPFRARLGIL